MQFWRDTMRCGLMAMAALMLVAAAAEPDKVADAAGNEGVPLLSFGKEGARSFEVQGQLRLKADSGLSFRFARDGSRMFGAIYDSRDGTPLMLTDGKVTMLYDAARRQFAMCEGNSWEFGLAWSDGSPPFKFTIQLALQALSKEPPSPDHALNFDFRTFLQTKSMPIKQWLDVGRRANVASVSQAADATNMLWTFPEDKSRFVFFTKRGDEAEAWLEATHINEPVGEDALRFPDIETFKKAFPVVTPGSAIAIPPALVGPMLKLGYAIGNPPRDASQISRESFDASDKEFGEQVRTELSRLSIPAAPTSRPAVLATAGR